MIKFKLKNVFKINTFDLIENKKISDYENWFNLFQKESNLKNSFKISFLPNKYDEKLFNNLIFGSIYNLINKNPQLIRTLTFGEISLDYIFHDSRYFKNIDYIKSFSESLYLATNKFSFSDPIEIDYRIT